ncbi:MAG: PAS domain S-box protein [Syntrophomonadaceae bacterium]
MPNNFENRSVYRLQLHDHACLIYENEAEWKETVIPFIIIGLQLGQKCLYGLNNRSRQQIVEGLQEVGLDTFPYETSGQLLFLDQSVLPQPDDEDRLEQVEQFEIAFIKSCLAEGYSGVRLTCEAMYTMTGFAPTWSLVEANSRSHTEIFPNYPVTVLCQYERWKTNPLLLKQAIIGHPIIIKNGIFYENFAGVPDEVFLASMSDRWEAEHWLKTVEIENRERENLQLLRQTVEKSLQAMLAVRPDGTLITYNEAFRNLVGLSDAEIEQLPDLLPEWRRHFSEFIEEIGESGGFKHLQKTYTSSLGYERVLDLAIFKKYDYTGNVEYYYGSVSDITRQVEAEKALRRSEEMYRHIAENAFDMIAIFDRENFTLKYLSPSHKRLFNHPFESLLGKNTLHYIHPEDFDSTMYAIQDGLKKGRGSHQYRWEVSDGCYAWMESTGKIIEDGEFKGDVLVVTRDINEKKLAELALKKELEYRSYLIDNMNEVFVTYDLQHRITFVNRSVSTILGYDPVEMLGRNILDYIIPYHIPSAAAQIANRLQKGIPGIFETVVLTESGEEALVRIKSAPIIENDAIVGVMLLVEDISEHRKIEQEMARLSQLHTIGEIAAGIGHEIRNPMTTVKGFLQIMKQQGEFEFYQSYFNIMLEELERANAIISEFLSLAKNKLVDLRIFNLNDIITFIYPLLQADATLTDKSIVLDLQEIPVLLLDEKEIRQLLLNLVRNGLDAMEAGGTVYIQTYSEPGSVVLSVRDEGCGIAHEYLKKLGTPFFTTKESGTGLGLAICYSIAARHNASIEPVSTPSGTTFKIRFITCKPMAAQMLLTLE